MCLNVMVHINFIISQNVNSLPLNIHIEDEFVVTAFVFAIDGE